LNLRLQQVTPLPNVDVEASVMYDDTTPLNDVAYSLVIGIPLPVFNKNRGNIAAGDAELRGTHQDWARTRNDLIASLAQAYANYASSRTIAESYRSEIIRDEIRTYRGIYDRFRQAGDDLDFSQVVVSQQTLFDVVDQYLAALDAQWQALVDLARVLQIEDLAAMQGLSPPTE
jgi:outer membrane protein TolC